MHRAAIANAAEFQCVASTNWHHLSPEQEHVLESGGTLDRESRWHGRSWQACCICAMQYWSEELHKVFVAGPNCCFKNHAAVQKLLDPATYLRTWPEVPSAEMYASCAHLLMHDPALQAGQNQLFPKRLLFIMHKRRMSEAMCNGEKQTVMCEDCYKHLRKSTPEMPVNALANGRWLGRHPECMRSMPYGHRLLLPTRRVIMTKVIFSTNPRSAWERCHAAKGLSGLTMVVEQAPAAEAVLQYPPKSLADSFEAVFVGVDPDDRRKAMVLPINKRLFLLQHNFLQQFSKANRVAQYNGDIVATWQDKETPTVLKETFVDCDTMPEDEADEEADAGDSDLDTKYRGPADATLSAAEQGEDRDNLPWTFLCPDAADQAFDRDACWQIAAKKLEIMQKTAEAIAREEELSDMVPDKVRRASLLQNAREFKDIVGEMSTDSYLRHVEQALHAEVPAESGADVTGKPRLVVPMRHVYAKIWEPDFWQQFNPMLWCYGDCVYADPRLNEPPYKQPSFKDFSRNLCRREELENDIYAGENYQAELHGRNHFEHDPDIEQLLQRCGVAAKKQPREAVRCENEIFAVNRFRKDHIALFVLASFWRLMSGFTAINIGMRVPGIQNKLKDLATMTDHLHVTSAIAGSNDGVLGLAQSATHLFNLVMGKVVGSNGYRIACRHQFTAYTIHFGPPIILATPNIADNRNFLILLTQGQQVNLNLDADPEMTIAYEQLRLRVVNDPVGQAIVVELLLRLFVLHLLGALPDCVAQPESETTDRNTWFTDGVAASLTSLGCMCVLQAARGEMEVGGRGSLHGHWQIWALAAHIREAWSRYEVLPSKEQVHKLKDVVRRWLNFFQSSHHSSAQHLPLVFASTKEWPEALPITQRLTRACRMDGGVDQIHGYKPCNRPLATQLPLDKLPKKLPPDVLYAPERATQVSETCNKDMPICGQVLTAFPQYRRRNLLSNAPTDDLELPAASWCDAHVRDAFHIQSRAMIHVCGPSCWKYNKAGSKVCRHHCYHIVSFEPDPMADTPAEKTMKWRRDGRPLNNQLFVQEEAGRGRRGRIVPITVMPFETMTNYSVAAVLRCNFDNQSMLYLPTGDVLSLQNTPNIGPQPAFQSMNRDTGDLQPKWFVPPEPTDEPEPSSASEDDDSDSDLQTLCDELEREVRSSYQDAHNTGYYVNTYTTKVAVLGDKLLQGRATKCVSFSAKNF